MPNSLFCKVPRAGEEWATGGAETNWRSEYERLTDAVPRMESQVLEAHCDEVLHVSFSHDGRQIASCSKVRKIELFSSGITFFFFQDNRVIVWNHDPVRGRFSRHYTRPMSSLSWRHTWAAQYSPADTRLMVAGVTSSVGGEVAIFRTGRGEDEEYRFLCRVVNDPYDVLGCWVTESYFLSGTFTTDFNAELQVPIFALPKFRYLHTPKFLYSSLM